VFAPGNLECFHDAANSIRGTHDLAILKDPMKLVLRRTGFREGS